ncbi:hypothetical protein PO124_14970 [Bacillus licheniformis]|nr:hypothetical protein [Bacillus licheniformis]
MGIEIFMRADSLSSRLPVQGMAGHRKKSGTVWNLPAITYETA